MGRSLSLAAYMLLSRYGEGWFARGTSDANFSQRPDRPNGPLIWIHAESVGGTDAILTLARTLLNQNPNLSCLITSTTETVARALNGQMPARTINQTIPVDAERRISVFLDHWRPDLSVWTETSFQPAFVVETSRRKIPIVYIEAIMSTKSFGRYRLFNGMATSLLHRFDHILTQNEASKKHLQNLGVRSAQIEASGRLKDSAPILSHDETQRKALARAIAGRALWLAAMTCEGEEQTIIAAHKSARRSYPELLLIIAPRDPSRGGEIAAMLCDQGCTVARRSENQQIDMRTDVYLADVPEELGLWYRLAPVSFLGGSLIAHGGCNPLNAAALGSAILHGSEVYDFADSYDTLAAADACVFVTNGPDLAAKLESTLSPERAAHLATAAWGAFDQNSRGYDRAVDLLQSYLPNEAT